MRSLTMAFAVLFLIVGAPAHAEATPGYGTIGAIKAASGQGAALAALLPSGCGAMPGCVSYNVGVDAKDPDTVWVIEVWRTKAAHDASLSLPQVQAAIAKARPMIAGMGVRAETVPVAAKP